MKRKILIFTIYIFLLALIQSTLLNYVKIYNVKPNLLLAFIVSAALLRGSVEGAAVGFFAGLAQDIVSGRVLGLYSLLGLYLGLIIGSINKRLYRENFLINIFFTFTASIIYELLVYLSVAATSGQFDFIFAFKNVILPEAVYNSIASIPIFIFVILLNYRLEDMNKAARKY